MRYHFLTLALFVLAGLLWYLGMRYNIGLLVLAAGLPELFAWKRVFKKRAPV
ncbi:hypothetical protein [Massilia sp. 9I]|uniref:hypothetical protein n=1 Tax=Massilia sp. 9I TaxID=2653152 RepID=UPI0012F2DBA9|nr:hypothetical protein [Massilia sp. 9I]VXB10543.1 hypothetical protein MASSI9I_100135 [Massilia sp. 9I]